MEIAIIVAGLTLLFFLVGGIFGWIAFFRTDNIRQENNRIQRELVSLKSAIDKLKSDFNNLQTPSPEEKNASKESVDDPRFNLEQLTQNDPSDVEVDKSDQQISSTLTSSHDKNNQDQLRSNRFKPSPQENKTNPLIENIKANWMIWIGGVSIGLAGVFLVKYSIDNGLLSPAARIILAFISGIALHLAAFFLHQKKGQNDIFAALSGGASLILYSACLAALHLYQLMDVSVAFGILAIVSLATMSLALVQGPVLAAIGILGAYLVPVFVSTGSNNVTAALIYSFIVTCSALLLIRYVKRDWLWIGTLLGAGLWWLVSLTTNSTDISRLIYLLALAYSVVAVEAWDWRLIKAIALDKIDSLVESQQLSVIEAFKLRLKKLFLGEHKKIVISLLMFLLAWFASLSLISFNQLGVASSLLWILPMFAFFTIWLARHQQLLFPIAWLGFGVLLIGLLLQGVDQNSPQAMSLLSESFEKRFLTLLIVLSLVYSVLSLWAYKASEQKGYWSSLGLLAPLFLIALGYIRVDLNQSDWQWALAAALIGAVYFNILYRKRNQLSPAAIVAIIIAGHAAYSLVVVILFAAASLTLALAVQLITLAWLDRQFRLPILPILLKLIIVVIITRLTFNPWLLTYSADVHWSLWTYGGSFLCCVLSAYIIKDRERLSMWLKGAAAHLLVLTIIAETRYQLYDGNIFVEQYSYLEAAIHTAVWGALGCVYLIRMRVAGDFVRVYKWISSILLIAAFFNYVFFLLFINNPLFNLEEISSRPIFNSLLLAYGLPCLLAMFVVYMQESGNVKRLLSLVSAVMVLIFISLEIRHLWHGELNITQPVFDGELYTYSMIWLLMAIGGSLLGLKMKSRDFYRASMIFLLLVVAKIFLIDTAGLTSLWRVAAFMGLGLSLLGLAYLHQKMGMGQSDSNDKNSNDENSSNLPST